MTRGREREGLPSDAEERNQETSGKEANGEEQALRKDPNLVSLVRPYRDAVIAESASYPLWDRDPGLTLYHAATALERRIRARMALAISTSHPGALANAAGTTASLAHGFDAVVHELYKRNGSLNNPGMVTQLDPPLLNEADRAVRDGHAVMMVLECLDDVAYGTRILSTSGERVQLDFKDPRGTHFHAAVALQTGPTVEGRPIPFPYYQMRRDGCYEYFQSRIRLHTVPVGDQMVVYDVPSELEAYCLQLADATLLNPELPPTMSAAGYSLADFAAFYRELYRIASIRQVVTWFAEVERAGQASASLVLTVTRESLYEQLVQSGTLTEDKLNAILLDLTYDARPSWASISLQPLLPFADGTYLIIPTLVTTSAWERNLMKVWANAHHDEYSRACAAKRAAEAELKSAFSELGFTATSGRKVARADGSVLGDADVAVYDGRTNSLFLPQVKWLIEPGTSHEARVADLEVEWGAIQSHRLADEAMVDPERVGRALFDEGSTRPKAGASVRGAVICRGHLGVLEARQRGLPVIDYYSALRHLRGLDSAPELNSLVEKLSHLLDEHAAWRDTEVRTMEIPLAGYTFVVEGFRRAISG